MNLIKVLKRHPDVNPDRLRVDLFLDASCLGHLLRPSISIKNRVINNVINNIRNKNTTILRLLPNTIIRYGWTRGDSNPADLTSKLFLTPSAIINSSFYCNGPVYYLSDDPYGHVFLTVNRDGENYNPPPSELGVVSVDQCSVCKFPENCFFFSGESLKKNPTQQSVQKQRIPTSRAGWAR